MEFEWDISKELENIRKHRVSFSEAVESFRDPDGFKMINDNHSQKELRYFWIGQLPQDGRVLTTWFTYRGKGIRIIGSAEFRKFRKIYERAKSKQS